MSENITLRYLENQKSKKVRVWGKGQFTIPAEISSVPYVYALFKKLPFKITDPVEEDLALAKKLINEKDAPILAAAKTGKVDWLLSLSA